MREYNLTVFYPGEAGTYSIRRVSESLIHRLPSTIKVRECVLPGKDASLKSIVSNILYILKNRNKTGFNYLTIQSYYVLALLGCNRIITVHDLNPIYGFYGKKDNFFKKKIIYFFWIYLPIILTSRITCVSEYTKKQCIDHVSNKDMKVIYNTLHPSFENIPKRDFNNKCKKATILLVGTGKQKNIETVFNSVCNLDIHINIIGKLSESQTKLLKKNRINYSNYVDIEDSVVCRLYIESDIVAFISLSEGFGMPILEAQASGCVLLCSNIEPLKEVAGDGALFVEPLNVNSVRNSILTLLDDPKLCGELIKKGYKNIRRFDSSKIINQFLSLMK